MDSRSRIVPDMREKREWKEMGMLTSCVFEQPSLWKLRRYYPQVWSMSPQWFPSSTTELALDANISLLDDDLPTVLP